MNLECWPGKAEFCGRPVRRLPRPENRVTCEIAVRKLDLRERIPLLGESQQSLGRQNRDDQRGDDQRKVTESSFHGISHSSLPALTLTDMRMSRQCGL